MVRAYRPLPKFPSISITGNWCALNCKYCRGRVLNEMMHVYSPSQLYALCRKLKERYGIVGCLISGGFTRSGKLPIKAYLSTIRDLKRDLGLIVSVHAGMVDRKYAEELRRAGVDIVDLCLPDPKVSGEVMNLKIDWVDIENTLDNLQKYGPPYTAPHILIGANYGELASEFELVSLLRDYDPYVLVLLVILNVKGTPFENISPPSPMEVVKVFDHARKVLSRAELALGCMRPRGSYSEELELSLMEMGLVDRIVLPSSFKANYIPLCCSLPREIEEEVLRLISGQGVSK